MATATYRMQTLGCRVNHAERRQLEAVLRDHGLRRAGGDDPADVEVIHSCAVTTRAAAKSRNAARRAARRSTRDGQSEPLVVITGCLARDPSHERNLVAAGGPENLIGHAGERPLAERFADRLQAWLEETGRHRAQPRSLPVLRTAMPHPRDRSLGHVRAEVKIQDGCDAHCTFCIIPTLRPTLRSKPIAEVVDEVRRLVDAGHVEVVLTGIFIGAWGHETALRRRQTNRTGSPLADLLDAVAAVPGLQRLRLSSMEPGDVDEPLLDAMVANDQVIVPHLHLPLQSGSDRILKRMNRQYNSAHWRDMLHQVHAALGRDVALTTDIICGFHGETDADFQATRSLAIEAGFLHMHVFPYSPRPGTAAARWRDQAVDGAQIRQRVKNLINLETAPGGLREQFQRRLLDRPLRVIIEQVDPNRPGHRLGRCDHYALVAIDAPNVSVGQLVTARATRIQDDVLLARLKQPALSLPRFPEGCAP